MAKGSDDRALAGDALLALRRRPSRFTLPDGSTIRFPKVALDGLIELLTATADGDEATVVRSRREVTTQQTARVLNMSRPTIIKLIDDGVLPARKVGCHRRVPLQELMAYRDEIVSKRRAVLEQMTVDAEELGLYD